MTRKRTGVNANVNRIRVVETERGDEKKERKKMAIKIREKQLESERDGGKVKEK